MTGRFALSTEVTLKNIPHFQPPWEKHFLGHRNQCCSEALLVGTTKQIQVTSSAEKPRVIPTENLRVCHVTPRQRLCFPTRTNSTLQEAISGAILILWGSNIIWKGTREDTERHWSVFQTKGRVNMLVQFFAWPINGIQQLYPAHSPCAKYCRKDAEAHS